MLEMAYRLKKADSIGILSAAVMVLIVMMCAALYGAEAVYADHATSGECGDNVSWSLSGGTLTISGVGEISIYSSDSQPWAEFRDEITQVDISYGVTVIPGYAFYHCSNLEAVSIPGSMKTIGAAAFDGTALKSVVIPQSVKIHSGTARILRASKSIQIMRITRMISIWKDAATLS